MSWFSDIRSVPSAKNGLLRLERFFGSWTVRVHGWQYTGPGLTDIWTEAMKKIRPHLTKGAAVRVLHLGMAAGGTIKQTYELFPGCSIDAVDYDPTMAALARELSLWAPYPAPTIHVMDAKAFLEVAPDSYGLILVDLFEGGWPSMLLLQESFAALLNTRVTDGGAVLINVLHDKDYLAAAQQALIHIGTWNIHGNTIGAFKKRNS